MMRTPPRRVQDYNVHEEIPPRVEQVPQVDDVPIMEGDKDVPVVPL